MSHQQSVERLRAAFGHNAPSQTTVFEWYAEFKRGRRSLDDEARFGRHSVALTADNIAAVQALVEEDARVTVVQLGKAIGINLHHPTRKAWPQQGVRTPHQLSEDQKAARVNWYPTMLARFDGGRSNAV